MESVEQLLKIYNSDLNNRKLRDLFKRKSFMEILRKNNDENAHSAFLKWLLEGKGFSVEPDDSPLMTFLDLLISKDDRCNKIDSELRKRILARQVKIEIEIASVEKCIKDVSTIKSQDRLDVYFLCRVIEKDQPNKSRQLEIIIENKISSLEGSPKDFNGTDNYKTKYQTERYYYALDDNGRISDSNKIFVYLTKKGAEGPKCADFIHISYQDIYDSVLLPISNLELTNVTKVFIDEYIKTITFPSTDTEKQRIYLAFTEEEVKMLGKYLEQNSELLIKAAKAKLKKADEEGKKKEKIHANEEDELLIFFWDSNEAIIQAIREAGISNIDDVILDALKSAESQRDTTQYFYVVDGEEKKPSLHSCNKGKRKRGNGKGATVLAVVHELIAKGMKLQDLQPIEYVDSNNGKLKRFSYILTEEEWKDQSKSKNKKEEFNKRNFTESDERLDIGGHTYYVSNQWGVGDEFNAFIKHIKTKNEVEVFPITEE